MPRKEKPQLPNSADVVVIGGGIIGCSTAWYLANRGMQVVVIEKCHTVGHEQSSRNWGFVRQLGRDPKELPLMMRSNAIWQGLEKDLDADLGWFQGGILGMTDDAAVLPDYDNWQNVAKSCDLECKVLNGDQVAELIPAMDRKWAGGIFVPSDGNADPEVTTLAFARAFEKLGGHIETGCSVLDVDVQGGAVRGVVTDQGEIKATNVVVAAGAWTSRVLQWVGFDMPQMRVRGSVARTMPVDRLTDVAAWTPALGFVQRRDNCFTISGLDQSDHDVSLASLTYAKYFIRELIEHHDRIKLNFGHPFLLDLIGRIPGTPAMRDPLHTGRIGDPYPNKKSIRKTLENLHDTFRSAGKPELKKAWAGHIDLTPDMLPVIEATETLRGMVIASGFSGHGFGIGPGAGATIAELVAGDVPQVDLSDFRLGRFAAGEWDEPYNLI